MNTVSLRNTRDFPHYKPRSALSFQGNALIKSDQWTYGEVATQWETATPSELIILWLWHNGEIREIYRLAPMTITHAALLEGTLLAQKPVALSLEIDGANRRSNSKSFCVDEGH